METKDLGLPIEYQLYPEYFDSAVDVYNTNEKNNAVEEILCRHKVKTVFDMTCGTGAQVLHLSQLGYSVFGSDFSPGLVKIAQEKAHKQNIAAEFICADMRNVQVGQFDAVITIDNAIGHLVKDDFEITIRNIGKNLKNQGIYIFDILNLEAMTDEVIKADSEKMSDKKIMLDGSEICTLRQSFIDRDNGYLTSKEDITIFKNKQKTNFSNTCTLKIYTAAQLREMLERNGFAVIEQHKINAYTFASDNSGYSILTVARKQ